MMNCSALLLAGLPSLLLSSSAFAQVCSGGADAFEDNDACSTAAPISSGTFFNLNVDGADRDFFTVTVDAGQSIDVTVPHDPSVSDIDVYLFDPSVECDTAITGEGANVGLASAFTSNAIEILSWVNTSGLPLTLVVEVRIWGGDEVAACNDYDLMVVVGNGADSCDAADPFDPNEDCATAAPIGDGQFFGHFISAADVDFFAVELAAGATLDVSIFFTDVYGDIDLYLWDPAISCDSSVQGQGTVGGPLALGFSASDDEIISYTNPSGATQSLVLEVSLFQPVFCASYDLVISGTTSGGASIGTNYCTATPNSTGSPGVLSGTGSAAVVDNDVELAVASLPPGVFGIFLVGQSAGLSAVGDGNLCLGGTIGRYIGPTMTFQSDAAGEASLMLDLGMIPMASQFIAAQPGDTLFFQAWHRDANPAGASSNFTDALEVTFI